MNVSPIIPQKKARQAHNIYKDEATGVEIQFDQVSKLAPLVDKDMKNVPEGHAVIIMGYGQQEGNMYPQPVSCGGHLIWVPRGSMRAVPVSHLNVLMEAVETRLIQPRLGVPAVEYEANRFDLQILKMPKGASKDLQERLEQVRERAQNQRVNIN